MSIKMSNIFLLRRLHSLSGLIPIGTFLIEHFYTNFAAVDSPRSFDQAVGNLRVLLPGPLLPFMEISFIGLPIIFHALLGIYIARQMKSNVSTYPYFKNWLFMVQRIAGIFLIIFIGLHVASMRFGFWGLIGRHLSVSDHFNDPFNTPYQIVHTDLANPVVLSFYLIGVLAAAYHFGFGLWSFTIHWGLTISERSQKMAQWICAAIGLAVLMMGVMSAFAFV